jgi:hypothetical protein
MKRMWRFQFFTFEATYRQERNRPNLLFAHYNDLKEDLAGEMHANPGVRGLSRIEIIA